MIETVLEISRNIMKDAKHVKISGKGITSTFLQMKKSGKSEFPKPDSDLEDFDKILVELIASSINYCYWYGRPDFRPLDSSSQKMGKILQSIYAPTNLKFSIDRLKEGLAYNRFPMLEERVKHLDEIKENGYKAATYILAKKDSNDYDELLETLVHHFPGYASDMFLKRASLFFLQMYRFYGWFEGMMNVLFVPADYQVPKLLEFLGCMEYSKKLKDKILSFEIIQKYSLYEVEIRAATILICEQLKKMTGWNISDIDGWLWLRRKNCNMPFHLTITTDY